MDLPEETIERRNTVLRKEAIQIILKEDIAKLTRDEREGMLWNAWGIDEQDPEFHVLSKLLQQELLNSDEPTNDVMDSRYDELLIINAEGSFYGHPNEYLAKCVSKIVGGNIKVEGHVEKLLPCPCCTYETMAERGEYDICPVCFWEDDGNDDPSRYSGPNHMTLSEGRKNFEKYGACSERETTFVAPDRFKIYSKADNDSRE